MKKIIFSFILIIVVVVSCKKKPTPEPEPTVKYKLGTIAGLTANGNSLPRVGMKLEVLGQYYTRCNVVRYDLSLTHQTSNSSLIELFYFAGFTTDQLGKIKVYPDPTPLDSCDRTIRSSMLMVSGKDVIIAEYNILRGANNYVTIESFDKATNEVTGTIDVTYIENGTSVPSRAIYPDTIRFVGARFKVPLN